MYLLLILLLFLTGTACSKSSATQSKEQYDLGVRYLEEGNYKEAVIAFTTAIEIDPSNMEAYSGRAQGLLAPANTKVTEALEQPNVSILDVLNDVKDNWSTEINQAVEDLQIISDRDDSTPGLWKNIITAHLYLCDFDKALELFNTAVEKIDIEEIHDECLLLGNVLQELERYTDAKTVLVYIYGDDVDNHIGTVSYRKEDKEMTFKDQAGQDRMFLSYGLIQVDGSTEAATNINNYLLNNYNGMFDLNGPGLAAYQEAANGLTTFDETGFHRADCKVTNNSNGILSIEEDSSYFAGGLEFISYRGFTFDIYTGEPLGIPELMNMDEETALKVIKSIVIAYKNDKHFYVMYNGEDSDLTEDTVYNWIYTSGIDDYQFIIEDGEIVLLFAPEELSMYYYQGPDIIHTGINIFDDSALELNLSDTLRSNPEPGTWDLVFVDVPEPYISYNGTTGYWIYQYTFDDNNTCESLEYNNTMYHVFTSKGTYSSDQNVLSLNMTSYNEDDQPEGDGYSSNYTVKRISDYILLLTYDDPDVRTALLVGEDLYPTECTNHDFSFLN